MYLYKNYDGQHPDHYSNQNGQDMNKLIIDFCKEPRSVQEIMDKFFILFVHWKGEIYDKENT